MKETRKDTERTRKRLLKAAYKVFCDKGYRDATIAEICELAGTNIASVNYHFGDKESLYRETWRDAFEAALRNHPISGGLAKEAAPEARLGAFIRSIIGRIVSESSDLNILHKEISNPTGLLDDMMRDYFGPQLEEGCRIIAELLGEGATEKEIIFCHSSVLGQCFHIGASRKSNKHMENNRFRITDVEGYIDHALAFSLAGIREVRDKRGNGGQQKASLK